MPDWEVGDRVRIDIPDETDVDHGLHGTHGVVVDVIRDKAGEVTGDPTDSVIYRIDIEDEDRHVDVRGRDLRPPIDV